MPDPKTFQSWGRQSWWATFLGAAFFLIGYVAIGFVSPDVAFLSFVFMLIGQLLFFAGLVGFFVYGWFAGFGSVGRPSKGEL